MVLRDNALSLRDLAQKASSQNDTMLSMAGQLKVLALKASSESRSMLSIAEHARYDSRTMRIVSYIALIYLPANLVSVSNPLNRLRDRG